MALVDYTLTRFQFRRDRVIGNSQVRAEFGHVGVLELHDSSGQSGTGFFFSLFHPLPALAEIERVFREEAWPGLEGQHPAGLIHRRRRPRGGNIRAHVAARSSRRSTRRCWDLAAQGGGPAALQLLGGTDPRVRAYASGLDFHLSDDALRRVLRRGARRRAIAASRSRSAIPISTGTCTG